MTAGELWLIILGFIFALVFFMLLALGAKWLAEREFKKNKDVCQQDNPCTGCVCGRGIGKGNIL